MVNDSFNRQATIQTSRAELPNFRLNDEVSGIYQSNIEQTSNSVIPEEGGKVKPTEGTQRSTHFASELDTFAS